MSQVMIVDDQPYMYDLLSEDLTRYGHSLTHVKAADELPARIQDSRPDLILLDLFLQGFEGLDLIREIKQDQPEVPIIILTAYDSLRDDPRVDQADGYEVKSFDTLKLISKINSVLNGKKKEYSSKE